MNHFGKAELFLTCIITYVRMILCEVFLLHFVSLFAKLQWSRQEEEERKWGTEIESATASPILFNASVF